MALEVGTRTNTEKRKIPNPSLTGVTRVFRHSHDGNLSFSLLAPIMFIVVFVLSGTANKSHQPITNHIVIVFYQEDFHV